MNAIRQTLVDVITAHQQPEWATVCMCGRGVIDHAEHLADMILESGAVVEPAAPATGDDEPLI